MAKTKVIVVGASHGGHQSIKELSDRYNNLDITLLESGDYVSFMSCGMQLYLEGKTTGANDVRNFRPSDFPQENIHILNNHEAQKINADQKTVSVKDTKTGQVDDYPYDKLILSSGVNPNSLPIPGADLKNVFLMRGYEWAQKIKGQLENPKVKNVTIVGAGYIGIEAAEVAQLAGKNVTIMDVVDEPLKNYLDPELIKVVKQELKKKEVKIVTGANIQAYQGSDTVTGVKTKKQTYPADLVIQATGVKPNTNWLKGTVDLDNRGWIKTNDYLQTNLPDVYAIGDATLAYSVPAGKKIPIALATVVRREARYVVANLFGKKPLYPFKGVAGSSALSAFDYHFSIAGLNSAAAKNQGISAQSSYYAGNLRPAYIPKKDNPQVYTKLVYAPLTHQLLGGEVLSKYDISAYGNTLSLAIQNKLTVEDLAQADFFFQPGFDRQWNILNLSAQHDLGESKFQN